MDNKHVQLSEVMAEHIYNSIDSDRIDWKKRRNVTVIIIRSIQKQNKEDL